jgi:hypothetical protein
MELTNPANLNAPTGGDSSTTTNAKAVKIISISSRMNIEVATHVRCPNCKSQVVVGSLDSSDLLDLNWKRHFCDDADRIKHEEKCVTKIQKIIEYYNRLELSSFQLGLKMDD